MTAHPSNKRWPDLDPWIRAITAGERTWLARAITLIESHRPDDQVLAASLLDGLAPHTGHAFRLGLSGVPGVGKSTLIENLGLRLCNQGHRLAVLAVDPTSSISGGSILGDKTRMEELARHPSSFIRPSPTAGTLGGVARKTRESILLCEAAGYNTIFVETVGVGQSEVAVHSMVDCFLVLLLAGAGDGLQGIKKGILELADLLAVTKADGDNIPKARAAREELLQTLRGLPHHHDFPQVLAISAYDPASLDALWKTVETFLSSSRNSGNFDARRHQQRLAWLDQLLHEEAVRLAFHHPPIRAQLDNLRNRVASGEVSHTRALHIFRDLWAQKDENH
jgi:LAO/AO transport system kinase